MTEAARGTKIATTAIAYRSGGTAGRSEAEAGAHMIDDVVGAGSVRVEMRGRRDETAEVLMIAENEKRIFKSQFLSIKS